MDDRHMHSAVESHNLKFIIPKTRRPTQPGLEVTRYAENEASSPQVVEGPTSRQPLGFGASSAPSPHGSQRRAPTRGTSSRSLPETAESTASRQQSLRTHSSHSRSSQVPMTDLDIAVKRQLQDLGFTEPPPIPPDSRRKLILGLTVRWFWIIVSALVAVLAVGLGVGLAVGLSNRASTSPTPTSGYATPTDQGTQGLSSPAPSNSYCPSQNGSVMTPYDASGSIIRFNNESPQSFTLLCNTYFPAKAGLNDGVRDILVMFVPDMYACMQLCAEYNSGYSDAVGDDVSVGGGICVSAALERVPGGFCHLQNATGINDTSMAGGDAGVGPGASAGLVDTAVLVGNWSLLDSGNLTAVFGGNLPGE